MMPPSTNVAPPFSTMPAISRAVAGDTALPSTNMPPNRSAATRVATSTAACGGQTDRITSLASTTAATEPASSRPASLARLRVVALRPSPAHTTRAPPDRTAAPTMLPISPGFRSPIVVMPSPSLTTWPREADRASHLRRPRQRVVRLLDLREPVENLSSHRRAPARGLAHVQRHQLVRRRQGAIFRMIHLMDVVDPLGVVPEQHGRKPQRIALPDLLVVGHVGLEAEGGHVPFAAMGLVETDPPEELVGRVVEHDQVVAHVHVPVVVDPLRPHDIAVLVERSLDHAGSERQFCHHPDGVELAAHAERRDAGRLPLRQPLADALARAAQGDLVDQGVRHRGLRLRLAAVQVELLDLRRRFLVAV